MGRTRRRMLVLLLACALFAMPFFAGTTFGAEEEAEHVEEGWEAGLEIPRIINFVIIVFVLWLLLRKPLARYFANRREEIQKLLEEAVMARAEAQARVEEYREKMQKLEEEVAALRSEAEADRENLHRNLQEDARKSADRVVEQARVNIELERKRATDSLKTEASLLALELAEGLLKEHISPEDRERMDREFIEGLSEE